MKGEQYYFEKFDKKVKAGKDGAIIEYNGETLTPARSMELHERWTSNSGPNNTVTLMLMSAQTYHFKIREMLYNDGIAETILKKCANKELQYFYQRLIRTWLLVIDMFSIWLAARYLPECWGAPKRLLADQYVQKLLIRHAECYLPHFFEPLQYKTIRRLDIETEANSYRATRVEKMIFGKTTRHDYGIHELLFLYQDGFTAAKQYTAKE